MKEINFTIEESAKGRLDKVIAENVADLTRSQVQSLIKKGQILVNDVPTTNRYQVKPNDQVIIKLPDPVAIDVQPEKMDLDIVYEDDDVIVVNKPQGMVVHPAPGHDHGTLVNGLLAHTPLATINGELRPGIVHRIDKDTSGLLMVAKNDQALVSLSKQLKDKTNQRKYWAIVHGNIKEDTGTINAPIGRSKKDRKKMAINEEGRPAVTHFKVLERFGEYTLIECQLETGRTHQIRVHLKYIGHPVAGDPLYGPRKTLKGNGQFLHAKLLGFKHPRTGEKMVFEVDPPAIFQATLKKLRAISD
ncbi:RluA family pseudouridine synthase [Pediococcus acidilactici]|jgi:23S rRNA pseudouridine1911/1915/1917 synthase|uniref:RluA family pseudouridine synthase n=1 Tax=Pediococcus acidilactici TaxID=1254 RepID=UPI000FE42A05|nr:RluA family pseudouridine synthase [Pediococcus acidilactici]KAF0373664.1 RluA family pseudouridine synthase [Pediococcus acidilactici]KAF0384024.1 RluA family pseudouridine synthase [Pediococcus acidilactici]KAF0457955.1 RluA family pseudouridine synthase [Pediococcus acidilactici]KAF0477378.1 RluA family pseudouridine synthase [Pediococcus acidilactici]KAF0538032.1 RluA family pseudouridine synthase [Pediococcus acidilactici]